MKEKRCEALGFMMLDAGRAKSREGARIGIRAHLEKYRWILITGNQGAFDISARMASKARCAARTLDHIVWSLQEIFC